jgi:hypothetical protein
VETNEGVVMRVECPQHRKFDTLVCSDIAFYKRLLAFDSLHPQKRPPSLDIEELVSRASLRKKAAPPPFMMELALARGQEVVSEDELLDSAKQALSRVHGDYNTVIKLSAKLSQDMKAVNARVLSVLSYLPACVPYVVLEGSFDRIAILARMPDSCFLKARVYPLIRLYVAPKCEAQALKELTDACATLSKFKDMHAGVSIHLSPDHSSPELEPLFSFARQQHALLKVVSITVERPPSAILADVKSLATDDNRVSVTDAYKPVQLVELATSGAISPLDFVPVSTLQSVQSLLFAMNHGLFHLNSHALCGFGTILVNSPKVHSMPITQLFNVPELVKGLYEEHFHFMDKDKESFGFWKARTLKKLLKKNRIRDDLVPEDVLAMWDAKKVAPEDLPSLQILLVHNYMDIGTVDLVRRSECTACVVGKDGLVVAQCTGCL